MARSVFVVTGTRHAASHEKARVWEELDRHKEAMLVLLHGAAPGVDTWAGEWASSRGVPCEGMPARWRENPRSAGIIRNQEMLDRARFLATVPGNSDLEVRILGFPGIKIKSAGTRHCLGLAMRLGIKLQACVALEVEERTPNASEPYSPNR